MILNMTGGGAALNFDVKAYAAEAELMADTPKENTIGIITDTPISSFIFASENPYIGYRDVDLLSGVTLGEGYITSDGSIHGQTTANPELYTNDYIPVEYGKSYEYRYTVSASKNMYLSIAEYTGSYTFSTRLTPVNSVTGTYQVGTYTPSSESVTAVRLSWRTFPSTTYTMEFIERNVPYLIGSAEDGTVWIQTGTSSVVEFNLLKKNAVKVYPLSTKQYISGVWKRVTTKIFHDKEWYNFFDSEILYSENIFNADYVFVLSPSTATGTLDVNCVTLKTVASQVTEAYIRFGPYDLTYVSTIKMICTLANAASSSSTVNGVIFTALDADASYTGAVAIATQTINTSGNTESDRYEVTLDVSDLTGEYYLYCGTHTNGESWGNVRTFNLYELGCYA